MNRPGVRVLVVLASVFAVLALVAGYVRGALVDSDQFANRATAALADDNVRALVGDQITDQLILKHRAELTTARPLISSVVAAAVGTKAFEGLFRAGVRDVHRTLFKRGHETFTLTVTDAGTLAAAGLDVLKPSLAAKLRGSQRVELLRRDIGTISEDAVRLADRVRFASVLLLVLAIACAVAALVLAVDRRRAVVELGIGAACVGIVLVVTLDVARAVALNNLDTPEGKAAAGAVWDAFAGDLRTGGWILAGAGAVVAAAAASLLRPVELGEPVRRAARVLAREPRRPALRALRALLIVLTGIAILLDRDAFVNLVVTVVGVYLVYEGTMSLLRLIYRPAPEHERVPARQRRRGWVVAGVPVLLIAAAAAAYIGTGGTSEAAPVAGPCLGHDELCDRPFDKVALAATHNAMSAPLPGWFSIQQSAPIAAQLDDGIRGLLIDTHYADRLQNGRLRTVLDKRALKEVARSDGVSPTAVDAALRLRERAGFSGKGTRGMYLCHSFCELGGTPLQDGLRPLRDFLVAHPNQIVVVINQDYVTPGDFVGAVRKAGLEEFVYRGPASGRSPTVKQMLDSNQRLLILAENRAGAAPWYHSAYDAITQETPFRFRRAQDLIDRSALAASCAPNRGPASAPLFLVNHWITTDPAPQPSNAAKVNARGPLLARLRECERLRGQIPNLVAVDFYREGDVVGAVDALNGVPRR